jgi:iron complex outermembrane receptor protein
MNFYGQYSRGYKGGGYQLDRSGMDPLAPALSQVAFDAETADSFELGLHHFAEDGTLRIGAALFHTTFNNYQFSFFSGINRQTQNVPELVTKGFEVEAGVRPMPSLEFTVATTYQEVVFGNSGFPSGLTQLEGSTPPVAPRWVVVGTASYSRDIGNLGLQVFGNADIRWQSRTDVGASAMPSSDFMQESYAVVGAKVGLSDGNNHWRLEFWGRNIFDQRAWSILNNTTLQPESISGYVTEPQTLGVTATWTL